MVPEGTIIFGGKPDVILTGERSDIMIPWCIGGNGVVLVYKKNAESS